MKAKRRRFACLAAFIASSIGHAAGSLEKAVAFKSNGLLVEAKRELVEVLFDPQSAEASKASALLMLGDIAVQEGNNSVARDNWNKLVEQYPHSSAASAARAKLEVLTALPAQAPVAASAPRQTPQQFAPRTTLVVGPKEYAWAAPQIAAALKQPSRAVPGTLADAVDLASEDPNVAAIVEVSLAVDIAFEWGKVICYRSSGAPVWDKSVHVTYPGSEEAIARRFVKKLSEKIRGLPCP